MISADDADDIEEAANYAKDLLSELIVMVLKKFPEDKNAAFCLLAITTALAHAIGMCARIGEMDTKGVLNIVRRELKSDGFSKAKIKKQRPALKIVR